MDMLKPIGERPIHRWVRSALFGGVGAAGAAWAFLRADIPMLASGLGLLMLGAAYFSRPLGHFHGLFSAEVFSRLASSPAVLFLWVGGWSIFGFGLLARLAL